MKLLIVFLTALPLLAHAADPQLPPQQAPLRMAKVHGTIRKILLKNGRYIGNYEKVCDFQGEVPVYGAMEEGKSQAQPSITVCETSAQGKAMRAQLLGAMNYNRARGDEPATKSASVMFFVFAGGKWANNYASQFGSAGGDESARLLTLTVDGTSYEGRGEPETVESFSAELTFEDVNQ